MKRCTMTMHAPSLGCCDDMTAVQVSQRHINLICACLSSPDDSSTLGLSSSQALIGCNMAKRKHQDSASSDSDEPPAGQGKEKRVKKDKKGKKEKKEKKEAKDSRKHKTRDSKHSKAQKAPASEADVPISSSSVVNEISEEDYFARNAEFSTWLKEKRQLFFNDLSAEETRRLFADFVQAWNGRKLPAKYYGGLVGSSMRRTNYQWGLKGDTGAPATSALGMAAQMEDEREAGVASRQQGRAQAEYERRKWNADQKQQLDELLPKATGREVQIENKIARREVAKAREASPELTHLPGGGDVMGGGDSFQAARAREAQRMQRLATHRAAKADDMAQRVSAAAAKEDDRMAAFRALAAAGPISIPKRS